MERLVAALLLVIALVAGYMARADDGAMLPRSMGSIGESISEGALAAFRRKDAYDPFRLAWLFELLVRFGFTHEVSSIEFHDYSWATGLDRRMRVDSHAQKLRFFNARFAKRGFDSYEAAISGEDSSSIPFQYERLRAWSEESLGQRLPDYLVFLLGPNDACAKSLDEMTPVEIYEDRVREFLERARLDSPGTRILLSSSPDLGHLREIAKDAHWGLVGRCSNMWKLHQFCNDILVEADPEKRSRAIERVQAYNAVLERLAAEYGRDDLVRYSPAASRIEFTPDDISVDCFHPARSGQELLAVGTWQDSWWSELPPEYEEAYEAHKRGQ